ncbi:amidoligase enzyme protein [Rutstroemia sp. NJR-2017a BVV2]|nr:amidoligase enzyme protein [Rutstroemia sp. NJR-2017a BVV2]
MSRFGVEFEFIIAAICDPRQPKIHPDDPRQVYFDTIDEDFSIESPEVNRMIATRRTIQRHVRAALRKGKFPTGDGDNNDIAVWEVADDPSIVTPYGEEYQYFGIEVRTPAFSYTRSALLQVRGVCNLLKTQFRVSVNQSCGLHVHVGNLHGNGFTLPHLRRIAAFLHAFEPQLDTVHPPHRLNNPHCASFRHGTKYACSFRNEQKPLPTATEATDYWLNRSPQTCKRAAFAACTSGSSELAYCLIRAATYGPRFGTVEFRQHEATLDSEPVVTWVKTVVGIMTWLRDASDREVQVLLAVAEREKWAAEGEKGGLHDMEMMQRFGPAFADGEFTFVDLLRRLGLGDAADYYKESQYLII